MSLRVQALSSSSGLDENSTVVRRERHQDG
jgi:hypothetical protein